MSGWKLSSTEMAASNSQYVENNVTWVQFSRGSVNAP